MYDIEREEISGLTTRGTHAFITFGYCIMRFDLQVISNFLGPRMPTLATGLSEVHRASMGSR
jgi:hypothetical protein